MLLSPYYLGNRSDVLGAFFTFLVILIFASIYPKRFMGTLDLFVLWSFVLSWAGFLILTAVIVGFTLSVFQDKVTEGLRARAEASANAEWLEQTMNSVREIESELDYKVEERTRALEDKTRSIRAYKKKVEEALHFAN